jgi:FMN phosphatase YigB (HAD superfamily)
MATAYTDFLSTKSYLIDGALATCRALSGECRLYVITNGIGYVQHGRFDPSPISRYFSGTFISEELGAEKPDRAYFDRVAAMIEGFDPATTLIVGDSLSSDMAGGVASGIDTCWFNPRGGACPESLPITYTVARLEDVVPIALGA